MSLLIVNTIQPQTGSIVNISGSLQISQSLIVADDITLSGKLTLGDANTDNIIVNSEFTSSLIPDVDGAFNLGTGVKKWGTVFAKSGSFDNISGSVNLTDGLVTITSASVSYLSGSSPITVGGAMIPDVTNTHNLGSAAKKYNDLFINDISASGDVTSSGTGSFTGGIDAANATGSFGYISASGTISTSGNILANSITAENGGELTGVIATPAQPQITSLGIITNLAVTNMTSSGNVTASSFQTNNITITAGGHVSASRVSASNGFEADTASTSTFGHISASGDIVSDAFLSGSGFNTTKNFAASADAFSYSVNGRKVEVRNQLQAQLNDGTFTHLELRNTSIATDSIVLGSFTGNTATNITGSIITAATTALYTASIQIHNETGENIANDTAFTASFIVL